MAAVGRLPASALVISLDALSSNIARLRSYCAKHTSMMAIVKV